MELLQELYSKNVKEYRMKASIDALALGKKEREESKNSLFYKSMREYMVRKRF